MSTEHLYNEFGHTDVAMQMKQRFPYNTRIRINHLAEEDERYNGKEGNVQYIDDLGDLHGTWGSVAIIPSEDDFTVLKNY